MCTTFQIIQSTHPTHPIRNSFSISFPMASQHVDPSILLQFSNTFAVWIISKNLRIQSHHHPPMHAFLFGAILRIYLRFQWLENLSSGIFSFSSVVAEFQCNCLQFLLQIFGSSVINIHIYQFFSFFYIFFFHIIRSVYTSLQFFYSTSFMNFSSFHISSFPYLEKLFQLLFYSKFEYFHKIPPSDLSTLSLLVAEEQSISNGMNTGMTGSKTAIN